jgi:hypothetical protein
MSHSEMMIVQADGDMVADIELRNGHGSAPCVWDALFRKYEDLIYPDNFGFMTPRRSGISGGWEALWAWAKGNHGQMRPWEWIALQWTYDNAVVKREDFAATAEALRRFADALVLPNRVCHLPAIAARLDELRRDEPGVRGVAHHHTSVSENPWITRTPVPGDDYEYAPYNIDRGIRHWFIDCAPATAPSQLQASV